MSELKKESKSEREEITEAEEKEMERRQREIEEAIKKKEEMHKKTAEELREEYNGKEIKEAEFVNLVTHPKYRGLTYTNKRGKEQTHGDNKTWEIKMEGENGETVYV